MFSLAHRARPRASIATFGAGGALVAVLILPLAVLAAGSKTVVVEASAFNPASFSVTAGTTIVFQNTSQFPHTATADNGSFDTGMISPGTSKSIVVSTAGTLPFHCQFHGAAGGVGQSGMITVTAAMAATPAATQAAGGGSQATPPALPSSATLPDLPGGWPDLGPIAFAIAGVLAVVLALVVDALRLAKRDRRRS